MATNRVQVSEDFYRWMMNQKAILCKASEVIVIGIGNAQDIDLLLETYPNLQLTIVTENREDIKEGLPTLFSRVRYVSTDKGLHWLKKYLASHYSPIPVLCFHESSNNSSNDNRSLQRFLLGIDDMSAWANTPAHFVLGSLFT